MPTLYRQNLCSIYAFGQGCLVHYELFNSLTKKMYFFFYII